MKFVIVFFICYIIFKALLNASDEYSDTEFQKKKGMYCDAVRDLVDRLKGVLASVDNKSDVETEEYKPLRDLVNKVRKNALPSYKDLKNKSAQQLFYENFGDYLDDVSKLKGWKNP